MTLEFRAESLACRIIVKGAALPNWRDGGGMKKASEYRNHPEECRVLAAQMTSDEQRDAMLNMAAQWERMAADRLALIRRHPELARKGEREEEGLSSM